MSLSLKGRILSVGDVPESNEIFYTPEKLKSDSG